MSLHETAVRCTTQRDECEIPAQNLANSFFYQRRFSSSRRTLDCNRRTERIRIRDPLTHHLHDLHLGIIKPVHCRIQDILCRLHECITFFNANIHRNRECSVHPKWNRHKRVDPILDLEIFTRRRVHVPQILNTF